MWIKFFCVIFVFSAISGCTAREATPEMNDPVYLSFNTEVASAQKSLEESEKGLEKARAELEKTEEMTGVPRHNRLDEVFKAENEVQLARQRVDYTLARRSVRLKQDRLSYNEAKNLGKPWPPPGEYADLERSRELAKRTRNYNEAHEDRLKKLAPSRSLANKKEGKEKAAHE